MDEAESGVIYLSLGSTIEPTAFDDLGNKFVEILGRLPQRVLMKWNRKLLQKVPSNFMVQEWIPQAEVLSRYYTGREEQCAHLFWVNFIVLHLR